MSTTTWTRLQPVTRDSSMESSLQATVHDPLWLLARQWMLGEFQGEDTGSPARVELSAASIPLTRYTAGPGSTGAVEVAYDVRTQPLETIVERERVRDDPANLRLAAEAGLEFLRLLDAGGLAKHRAAFVAAFPLSWPAAPVASIDDATRRWLEVMVNRVPDGRALAAALRTPLAADGSRPLPAAPAMPVADRAKVAAAVSEFFAWYDGAIFDEPPASGGGVQPATAWRRDRMEYEMAIAAAPAPAGGTRLELAAPEYVEGSLDWFAFDLRSPGPIPPVAAPTAAPTHSAIPAPVSFPGMPASRYWEMEDASVNLSAVQGGLKDLARLLVLEFALVFGNDWFIVPVELEVGSVCRIDWLTVTNTFGEKVVVPAQHSGASGASEWAMYTPSLDRRVTHGPDDGRALLVLAPSLVGSLAGPPIEEVLLVRDEMANLAWAVERVVESPSGRPLNRYEEVQAKRRLSLPATPPTASAATQLAYELGTDVPENWIPLVPEYLAAGVMQFRRAQMGTAARPAPRGRILDVSTPLVLREEEVPRAGARVTRAFQYARWIDGSTHLWVSRRKEPGRGESSSDLHFDRARPATATR